jgi:Ca2+-binding RTX toxin-like protein
MIGGNAADTIEGGRDDDFLTGNDGADVLIFRR